MSDPMQVLVGCAFGSLLLALGWRLNRASWADRPIVDLLRNGRYPDIPELTAFDRLMIDRNAEALWAPAIASHERVVHSAIRMAQLSPARSRADESGAEHELDFYS